MIAIGAAIHPLNKFVDASRAASPLGPSPGVPATSAAGRQPHPQARIGPGHRSSPGSSCIAPVLPSEGPAASSIRSHGNESGSSARSDGHVACWLSSSAIDHDPDFDRSGSDRDSNRRSPRAACCPREARTRGSCRCRQPAHMCLAQRRTVGHDHNFTSANPTRAEPSRNRPHPAASRGNCTLRIG